MGVVWTTLVAPPLAVMMAFVVPLDMLMSRIYMADKHGAERARYRRILAAEASPSFSSPPRGPPSSSRSSPCDGRPRPPLSSIPIEEPAEKRVLDGRRARRTVDPGYSCSTATARVRPRRVRT